MKIKDWAHITDQMSVIGSHRWSVLRLFELAQDLPVMDVPLDHLNVYYTYEKLTLRDMVMHMHAIQNADLEYPIILDEDGDLMDGRHRLMKAMFLENKTIKAVRFDTNPPPCEIRK